MSKEEIQSEQLIQKDQQEDQEEETTRQIKTEQKIVEKRENEISLEKENQAIIDFIESSFDEKFPFGILGIKEVGVDEDEKKKTKNEEINLEIQYIEQAVKEWKGDSFFSETREKIRYIQNIIFIYNEKRKEIKNIEEDIKILIEKGGKEMMPNKIYNLLQLPEYILLYLNFLKKNNVEQIEKTCIKITEIIENIFPEKLEAKSIQIEGFENFNSSEIKGEMFVKKALEFLPQKLLLGKNIKRIIYEDSISSMPKEYGFEGEGTAEYSGSKKEIKFFKRNIPETSLLGKNFKTYFLNYLPDNISHEAGHLLDPREVSQEKLSILEEIEMIKEWEKIRNKEKEFSDYVLKIKNKDEKIENLLKSQESFAETIKMFLINPKYLEDNCPQKFKFCKKWFKKQFPEESFTQTQEFYNLGSYYLRAGGLEFQYRNLLNKIKD